MQIAKFIQTKRCPSEAMFHDSLKKKNRWGILSVAAAKACEALASGKSYREVLRDFYEYLKEEYGKVEGYQEWQVDVYSKDDTIKLNRFFRFIGKPNILKANVPTTFQDGELILDGKANLIYELGGKVYLVIFRPGKCDRSPGGKSLHTQVSGDLRLLVAKWSLEKEYPGIIPWCVYLTHPDDVDTAPLQDFSFTSTKNTNLTVLPCGCYYKDGMFDTARLRADILAAASVEEEKNCDLCEYACLCRAGESIKAQQLEEAKVAAQKTDYALPKFTPSQMEVVNHKNGPLLVCAGAGSGKTAALVGRVAQLVKDGVSPTNILCVTFAKQAAEELEERCRALIKDPQRSPKISTIHGLAMDFLRGYGAEALGYCPVVLDEMTEKKIIAQLFAKYGRISGFKYEVPNGRYGYLDTALRRIQELKALGMESFSEKRPDIGAEFYDLARDYDRIVEEGRYVTYDEMVALATKLLKENQEVLMLLQFAYRYIMVDEFQDISKDQAEFIYLLAAAHNNLLVVGDDDQCIYRWRGAVPAFMVEFPSHFHAKTVVFPDNFRSTAGIVNTAMHVIGLNPGRIEKRIVSSSGREGVPPEVIHSTSIADLRRVISGCVDSGYHYGDIAIICRTNKALSDIKERLGLPCVLARHFLRQDPFFGLVKGALGVAENPNDAMSLALFFTAFGFQQDVAILATVYEDVLSGMRDEEKYSHAVSILDELLAGIKGGDTAKGFVERCKKAIFWESSDAPAIMLDEFTLTHPSGGSIAELRQWCSDVVEYASEKRVTEAAKNAVTLITNHDCKGLEYPVVLLVSEYSEKSPEERSLFYVGITRARERLFLFEGANSKVSFVEEVEERTGTDN